MRDLGRRGVLLGAAAQAACQQAPQAPHETNFRLSAGGTGYIAIQAPITDSVREVLRTNVSRLLEQNPAELYLLINSPGGSVTSAQDIIGLLDRTRAEHGIRIVTHNTGTVASAACYVFLAGQRRLSVPRGAFLFHEVSLSANGPIPSHLLQDASVKAQQIERTFLAMLTAKTRLTEAEASSFIRRTVILNAEEARRDGVIDAVADFTLPREANVLTIRAVPNPAAAPRPAVTSEAR